MFLVPPGAGSAVSTCTDMAPATVRAI